MGRLGLFQSLIIGAAFGFMVFFAACFVAILFLLFYNALGRHAVDMADAYRYVAFPVGGVALVLSEAVMVGFWLRHKLSGR